MPRGACTSHSYAPTDLRGACYLTPRVWGTHGWPRCVFVTLRHRTASTLSLKICRFVARAPQQIRNTAENLTPYTYRCQNTSSHTPHDLTCALPRRSDDPPSGGRWPLARPPWRPSVGRGTKSQSRPIGRRCSFGVEPGPPAHARLSPTVADAPGPRRCLRQPARSASIGRRRTGHETHRARRPTPPAVRPG